MPPSKLSPFQEQVRIALSGLRPPWTLTGGAALVGFTVGDATTMVETPHQLLVNKLCALLSRSELRDLLDVRVLVDSGVDLTRALADCPGQDAGFSPLTFAWSTRGLPVRRLAAAQGWSDTDIADLERFRDDLVARVIAESQPDSSM